MKTRSKRKWGKAFPPR